MGAEPPQIDSTLTDLIDECARSFAQNEMAIFCGAGVSFNSGLPLASQLLDCILRKLPLSQEDFDCLSRSHFPFEGFMRVFVKDKNSSLLDVFNLGVPNANHTLFARLVREGFLKLIVTTNFDVLFEKAFAAEALTIGRDIEVVTRNLEFSRSTWRRNRSLLVKIHGTISDRDTVAVTLRDVAAKQLSEPRKAGMDYTFSSGPHKKVLILGYSCSDVFDLSPQIAELGKKSNKEVLIVQHTSGNDDATTTDQKISGPFQTYARARQIRCDTDALVAGIARRMFGLDAMPAVPSVEVARWKAVVDKWFAEIVATFSESFALSLTGSLLNNISEFHRAMPYHERALRLAGERITTAPETEAMQRLAVLYASFGELGDAYLELGIPTRAMHALNSSLRFARLLNDKHSEASRLGSLGRAYCYTGDYASSLSCYREALSMFEQMGSDAGRAAQLTGLGHVYVLKGDYDETIKVSKAALAIARKLGDKKCEINNLGNIGLAFRHKGQFKKAIGLHYQAVEVALALGDKQAECQQFSNLGIAMTMAGKYEEAIECHSHARQLAEDIGFAQGECLALGNLGIAAANLGDHARAVLFFELALCKAEEIGDKLTQARCLFNSGLSEKALGSGSSARKAYRKALEIYETVFDSQHPEVVSVRKALAELESGA